jgi:hypothetical protein
MLCFSADFEAGVRIEQRAYCIPNCRVIVDKQNSLLRHSGFYIVEEL